jgi:SET domain-containing protein
MSRARLALFRVRRSSVHGLGVFAARRIRKGTRIVEYLGERVSHREADRRYERKSSRDSHTFLFVVDRGVVIDAGANGNEARFINHGCDPNCESVTEDRRVFVEAIRTIQPGEELSYDYSIPRDRDDPPNIDAVFACRCGALGCRGTMLRPPTRTRPRRARRTVTRRS